MTLVSSLAKACLALLVAPLLLAAAQPDSPDPRLPQGARPIAYDLDLVLDPAKESFSGRVRIETRLDRPAGSTRLNSDGLEIGRVVAHVGKRLIEGRTHKVGEASVIQIDWTEPLPAGVVTLDLAYSSRFRTSAEGLFHAELGGEWYAWTQLQPIDARRVFPGFDEPGFKTPFTVSITAPTTAKAFANTPEISRAPVGNGAMSVHRFAPSKPISTYMLSVGVGPFDVAEALIPANGVRRQALPFRVIAPRGGRADMSFALTETPKLLARLEAYVGSAYPYEKLDLIASPLMGGGQENPGLILFGDSVLLIGDGAPAAAQAGTGALITHELAHQWFGNAVTPTWWTDLWLNESLATWITVKIGDQWRPGQDFAAEQTLDAFRAMEADSLAAGRPIRQPITQTAMIASIFDEITYQKGAQVVSMFEAYVGEDKFRRGVQAYLKRYRHGSADADDFFRALARASGQPKLTTAMRGFTDQVGVPLVRIDSTGGRVALTQTRYLPLGVEADSAQTWATPLCISQAGKRTCTLLEGAAVLPLTGDAALIPNPGGLGYYRVTLDRDGWKRLIATAPSLSRADAFVMADSLWADFAAGRAGFADVAAAARSLSRHADPEVAVFLGARLKRLSNTLLDASDLAGYRRLMAELYVDRLDAVGWDVRGGNPGSEAQQAERQALLPIVALDAREPRLRRALADGAQAYLNGDHAELSPAYAGLAMRVAAQDKGLPFVEKLIAILAKSDDPSMRMQAARGLSAVESREATERVIALLTAGSARPGELNGILNGLLARPETRAQAAAFIDAHFDIAITSFPNVARNRIIGMFDGYCSPEDADAVGRIFAPKLALIGGGEIDVQKAQQTIRTCAALKAATHGQIHQILGSAS
jgi:aminopeptidase N